MTRIIKSLILSIAMLSIAALTAPAESRFPHPDFESGYSSPITTAPQPEASIIEYVDILVLFAALCIASYLVLKKRSRKLIFLLMTACLIYFGFYRKCCICPVGSLQNVALVFAKQGYALPITALALFMLPIIFTLFFGRTFCAAVCPLGAIQDLFIFKPIKLPWTITRTLRLIPYIYLGTAVLLAVTGSAFIVCRLDPFVPLFRRSGDSSMLLLAAIFLVTGLFIARPYCRFFCPYGVLLNWASRFSKSHMTITPSECIQCRLCENSCPFDAIEKPVPTKSPEAIEKSRKRLMRLAALAPVIIILSGWAFSHLAVPLSKLNNTVILAEQIAAEQIDEELEPTLRSKAFKQTGKSDKDLRSEALKVRTSIKKGSWALGLFIGLTTSLGLITFSVRRTRFDYEPDRAECLSCGRCFSYCPVDSSTTITQTSE